MNRPELPRYTSRQSVLNQIARELYSDKMELNMRPAHLGRNCSFAQELAWQEYQNWNYCFDAMLEMKGIQK